MRPRHSYARLSLLAFTLLLSSCAFAVTPRRVAFNESEFAPYRGAGSGSVTGQLVVTSDDGQTHISDGTHVTLLPVTSYTKEMVDREIGNGENLTSSDSRLHEFVRLVTTDAGGNFVFDHLRPGEYFVCGLAEWYVGDDAQYQWACERVTRRHGANRADQAFKEYPAPRQPDAGDLGAGIVARFQGLTARFRFGLACVESRLPSLADLESCEHTRPNDCGCFSPLFEWRGDGGQRRAPVGGSLCAALSVSARRRSLSRARHGGAIALLRRPRFGGVSGARDRRGLGDAPPSAGRYLCHSLQDSL